MIHRIEIVPKGEADPVGSAAANEIRQLGIATVTAVRAGRVFLIEGRLAKRQVERIGRELLADPVVEEFHVGKTKLGLSDGGEKEKKGDSPLLVEVFPKPGVMDPVALSARQAIADMGIATKSVRTGRIYRITGRLTREQIDKILSRVLANDCIEQAVVGSLGAAPPPHAPSHPFKLVHVPIRDLDEAGLEKLSADGDLFLNVIEMKAIRDYYRKLGREPTDVELETLAQTWSEHCVHKTMRSRVEFEGDFELRIADCGLKDKGKKAVAVKSEIRNSKSKIPSTVRRVYDNLLADTIVAATKKLDKPWCISVFKDNAGVIEFDDQHAICFKVETHNHPSAIEPYGGAATGIGGCIRDPMGTGLGAKPVANTDVFCFAPPDWPAEKLPKGVLHPRRVMRGVVAGVRDYGNRMGIPTVNGAIFFDERYLGNPLVFCGNVGLMDRDKCFKHPRTGEAIVLVGGRTGRDGIHGATFSSGELTHAHEDEFSHAVQIGNAITEKKLADVLNQARARGLYSAITDCGAGGLSSAVGEMGERLGARVDLETVPLKYAGLSYTEIWISEAQERMVLAVPRKDVRKLLALFASEDVEATVIGRFTDDRMLRLFYRGTKVGELAMGFLHDGLPKYTRKATWNCGLRIADCGLTGKQARVVQSEIRNPKSQIDHAAALFKLLGQYNIASKEWVIRQYDHEVQGGSVVKPLVGVANDGPNDGAVFTPVLGSKKGVALACGLCPQLGELDPYQMALHAIDECIRNLVCVGADPERIAILDNFCWGNCAKPDRLGSLVLAAQACHDGALAYGTPFISGKDSLNNEFATDDGRTISIPPTLLISGIGVIADVTGCLTMDAKAAGNALVVVGTTQDTLVGSHYEALRFGLRISDFGLKDKGTARGAVESEIRNPKSEIGPGGVPRVDLALGPKRARAVAAAISAGLVRSAHDASEGGLAVALAEMCFAGGLGLDADLDNLPGDVTGARAANPKSKSENLKSLALIPASALFGESPSRYLLEVEPDKLEALRDVLADVSHAQIGRFNESGTLRLRLSGKVLLSAPIDRLKAAWREPLNWQ